MSYDIMFFKAETAPVNKAEFFKWYEKQTEWLEDYSYDNLENTSEELSNLFFDSIKTFPAVKGPYSADDIENDFYADYSFGKDFIFTSFNWFIAKQAYKLMIKLAEKHKVGFFDLSNTGNILIPNKNGELEFLSKCVKTKKPWWKFS